jgi:hypothetical protein
MLQNTSDYQMYLTPILQVRLLMPAHFKVGITTGQKLQQQTKAKVGITTQQSSDITTNVALRGNNIAQATAITDNTSYNFRNQTLRRFLIHKKEHQQPQDQMEYILGQYHLILNI